MSAQVKRWGPIEKRWVMADFISGGAIDVTATATLLRRGVSQTTSWSQAILQCHDRSFMVRLRVDVQK